MSNHSEEKKVSQAYHSLKLQAQHIMPPAEIDESIQRAASEAISSGISHHRNKFIWTVSVAASIFIVAGVVLKMAIFSNATDSYVNAAHNKQPMYLLQRSKPASEKVMMLQLENMIDNNEIEQAKTIYKKFRYYYPEYQFSSELTNKLTINQID